jgi:AcrR family transcriptional regulator
VPARDPSPSSTPRTRSAGRATGGSSPAPDGNPQRITAAASELFAARGLGTTLADVARRAGVGVATVYRRFPTKDELIYEVYADRIRAGEELARQAATDPDAWAGFVRFLKQSIGILAGDQGLRDLTIGGHTRSLGWARGSEPDRLAELLSENHKTMGVHLVKLVRRDKRSVGLRRDFEATDMMLLSVAVQATIAFGGTEHPDLHQRALGFILDGLRSSRPSTTPLPAPAMAGSELPQARRRR